MTERGLMIKLCGQCAVTDKSSAMLADVTAVYAECQEQLGWVAPVQTLDTKEKSCCLSSRQKP